jgi:hypothetical protein
MAILARWALPISAVLVVVSCAAPAAPPVPARSATSATTSSSASATTTTAAVSPFCHDMQAFQAGVVVYRADVLQAAEGTRQLDVDGMRQREVFIAELGQSLVTEAPADISGQIHTVLDALATSTAAMTRSGATVRDVYEPLFSDAAGPAFDAVDKYNCD